jgi:hypothetical protein
MNASARTLLGGLTGGVLGGVLGLHAALWLGTVGYVMSLLPILFSPTAAATNAVGVATVVGIAIPLPGVWLNRCFERSMRTDAG